MLSAMLFLGAKNRTLQNSWTTWNSVDEIPKRIGTDMQISYAKYCTSIFYVGIIEIWKWLHRSKKKKKNEMVSRHQTSFFSLFEGAESENDFTFSW